MELFFGYPYTCRVLPLPPEAAKSAFDLVQELSSLPAAGTTTSSLWDRWSVEGESGSLELAPPERSAVPRSTSFPWRRSSGTLRACRRRRPGFSVELALQPWSDQRTEIGLTALSTPWVRRSRRGQLYLEAAEDVLDHLAGAMVNAAGLVAPRAVTTAPPGAVLVGRR